jgi:hypothetical protein
MKYIITALILLICIYSFWTYSGRNESLIHNLDEEIFVQEIVSDQGERNIVGIQPWMEEVDYLNAEGFYRKLNLYFNKASAEGFFQEKSVVVLPEYLGTWLVISGEKTSTALTASVTGAMIYMVLSNPYQFLKNFFVSTEADKTAAAIFKMKAIRMANDYEQVFKRLAKEYNVDISAGSILLPDPKIEDNHILINQDGEIYNTSFIFTSSGEIYPQVFKKIFPINSELPLIGSDNQKKLQVAQLNIGRTAVVVCADSWYPQIYKDLKEQEPEILLVNSFSSGNGIMNTMWNGYDGSANPDDVDLSDIQKITEGEAWLKYAMPGRIHSSGAKFGMNVFLRGNLWDLGSDGQPLIVSNGELLKTDPAKKGGIWNLRFK